MNTNDFIKKAMLIHGDEYDYSKSVYTRSKDKLIIICGKHGEFLQKANTHLSKHRKIGCPECGKKRKNNKLMLTKDTFISKVKKAHKNNNQYNFDGIDYKGTKGFVTVLCKYHGEFKIVAESLIVGQGCKKCYLEKRKTGTEEFIRRSKLIHNDYDYSLSEYTGVHDKIKIKCLQCETILSIEPHNHIANKNGCKCRYKPVGFYNKTIIERSKELINKPAILYFVKLTKGDESFIKIGITTTSIERRMGSIPYNYNILKSINGNLLEIFNMEQQLHLENKEYNYKPKTKFKGDSECFLIPPELL